MFEPFQRLRPRQASVGLGLDLVQQVVERHGGRGTPSQFTQRRGTCSYTPAYDWCHSIARTEAYMKFLRMPATGQKRTWNLAFHRPNHTVV